MKKLLTVLLTVLMAFTLVTVNVSADTYNKGWSGFSWRKLNTEAVEEVKEEEPVVEEVQEEVVEVVEPVVEEVQEKEEPVVEEVEALEEVEPVEEVQEEVVGGTIVPTGWDFEASGNELTAISQESGDRFSVSLVVRDEREELEYNERPVVVGLEDVFGTGFEEKTGIQLATLEELVEYKEGRKDLGHNAPTDAGTYTAELTYAEKTISLRFTIYPAKISYSDVFDQLVDPNLVYNGLVQYGLGERGVKAESDNRALNIEWGWDYYGGTLLSPYVNKAKNAGNYVGCIKLANQRNFVWMDGTTSPKTYKWSIEKAPLDCLQLDSVETKFVYNGKLRQPKLPDGFEYAILGNLPLITGYDCAAIDAGRYVALVRADSNHILENVPEGSIKIAGITYVKLPWVIDKAIVHACVEYATKVYGDRDPIFKYLISRGDPGSLSKTDEAIIKSHLTYTRESGENVGIYHIEVKVKSSLKNFEVIVDDFVSDEEIRPVMRSNTLEITPAPLTVKLSSTSKREDGRPFTPKFIFEGLKLRDQLRAGDDYSWTRVEDGGEVKNSEIIPVLDNMDHTTAKVGTKYAYVQLVDTPITNQQAKYFGSNYYLVNADDNGVVRLTYEIKPWSPWGSDAPVKPQAVVNPMRTIITKLAAKRFSR